MDKDLDILVQKFLSNDLSEEEKEYVDSIAESDSWKEKLELATKLEYDVEKALFLDSQRKRITGFGNKNKSKQLYYVLGIAALLLVAIILWYPKNDSDDGQLAESSKSKTENAEAKDMAKEEATDEVEEEGSAAVEESDIIDFNDEDIIENRSVYHFKPGNLALTELIALDTNSETGLLQLIRENGSTDSTYLLTMQLNDVELTKMISFVGEGNKFLVYNLIAFDESEENVQKSILLFDKDYKFEGRYIVSSVDDLPDAIDGNVMIVRDLNSIGRVKLEDPLSCIDLPSGETTCLSRY